MWTTGREPPERRQRRSSRAIAIVALALAAWAANAVHAGQQGMLWAISRDGEISGYLLGTIHSDDPRVVDFSAEFIEALRSCERYAMELVPDQPTLSRLMDYMHYQDGSTLASRIGAERYARLLEAVSRYHLGDEQLATMKVWAAMMTLSIPPPENGLFMDLALALQAAGSGLKVVGLETLEEQLAFLENMPQEQQLLLLDQALDEFDQLDEFYAELIEAYLAADLDELKAQSDEQFSELPPEVEEYFSSQGIDARNLRMRERVVAELEQARVFVAVGALHLPGERGIVSLLRKAGYELRPAPFPVFSAHPGGRP